MREEWRGKGRMLRFDRLGSGEGSVQVGCFGPESRLGIGAETHCIWDRVPNLGEGDVSHV